MCGMELMQDDRFRLSSHTPMATQNRLLPTGCASFKYNKGYPPPPEKISRRPAHSPQAQSRCKRLAGLLTYLALRCLPRGHAPSDNMMSHEHCEIHSSGNCSGFTPDSLLISVELVATPENQCWCKGIKKLCELQKQFA